MEILTKLQELVEQGKLETNSPYPRALRGQPGVKETVAEALEQGIDPLRIMDEALIPGMQALGRKFDAGTVYVPEVLLAMKAMKAGVEVLRPHLQKEDIRSRGTILIGTVQGDIHDIGKNLVMMLLESAGFETVDLGVNVPPMAFVEAVRERKPVALGLSALLTTTMLKMGDTIEALRKAGLDTPVIIGGAPITQRFADEIGAIYGSSPQAAIDLLEQMVVSTN